ncbi:Uncharacterised protein [Collinsella intestinalis]|nr:Uncharacterised protein [Collinsella intestinalis]
MRIFLGVTSTSSSSMMYSRASSRENLRGGTSCTEISAVEERWLPRFLVRAMFTTMSPG